MSADATILEFDGPATAYCFGRTYDALSSVGIKREGHPFPADGADTEQGAWDAYTVQLAAYKIGAQQIAWRIHPHVTSTDKGFYIYSRLAAYP